jgi:hypothetical protein
MAREVIQIYDTHNFWGVTRDFRIEYPFTTLRHVTALLTCSTVTFKNAFSYDLEQTVENKVPK